MAGFQHYQLVTANQEEHHHHLHHPQHQGGHLHENISTQININQLQVWQSLVSSGRGPTIRVAIFMTTGTLALLFHIFGTFMSQTMDYSYSIKSNLSNLLNITESSETICIVFILSEFYIQH